jgi:putative endonuclease
MTAALTGAAGYHAGLAAEAAVAAHYLRAGCAVVAKRWRGTGGEIDLVARDSTGLVFVEVKKSRSFARAAERLTGRQIGRILDTASEFLAGEPGGQDTDLRFDVALVNATGQIEVLENALAP